MTAHPRGYSCGERRALSSTDAGGTAPGVIATRDVGDASREGSGHAEEVPARVKRDAVASPSS